MRNVLWNSISAKIEFFCHFRSLRENMPDFWQKEFWRNVNIALYVSRWTFSRTFFEKNINFLKFLDVHQKPFWFLPKIFSRFCQNWILHLQTNVSIVTFLKQLQFFSSFPVFIYKNLSHFSWKTFGKLVKNVIWVSRATFWGKKRFWNE